VLNTVKTRLPLRKGAVPSNPETINDVIVKYEPDNAAPREKETKQSAAAPKTVDFRKRTFPSKLSLSRCVGDPMAIQD
jgi:hypothetical protein